MYVISLSCVALILQFLSPVVSISSPGPLTREVGQDVVFMFNATKIIYAFNLGIRDGNTNDLKRGLINYDKIAGMKLDDKINSTSYAGRVSFVGNLSNGQAWFKITNLNINDTNQYMAMIFTQGASGYTYVPAQLTVVIPLTTSAPTTKPLQTSTMASTYASVSSNITSSAPTSTSTSTSLPSTSILEKQSKPDGTCTTIIATCVTIIVILVVIVIALIIYIWKGKIKTEKTPRKSSLSNSKAEDLGAYENANQIDEASNVRVHEAAKPRLVEKELYETICENRDRGANTHPGVGTLAANEMTTRDPSVSGQDPRPVPSLPQHYQELTNLPKGQQIPLYEPLNKRNTNHSNDPADNPRTYEQLQQDVTGREYQSLQVIPNKEESKV